MSSFPLPVRVFRGARAAERAQPATSLPRLQLQECKRPRARRIGHALVGRRSLLPASLVAPPPLAVRSAPARAGLSTAARSSAWQASTHGQYRKLTDGNEHFKYISLPKHVAKNSACAQNSLAESIGAYSYSAPRLRRRTRSATRRTRGSPTVRINQRPGPRY